MQSFIGAVRELDGGDLLAFQVQYKESGFVASGVLDRCTNTEALYQQYLAATAVCSPLKTQPWGFREFMVRDPFGNGLLLAERIPESNARSNAIGENSDGLPPRNLGDVG